MADAASVVRRDDALLVVIDVQDRLAAAMPRRDAVAGSTAKLLALCGIVGMPVIATLQNPAGLGGFDLRVESALTAAEAAGTSVVRVEKLAFDCFAEPAFADAVEASGRRQLVLAGMETHICVAQTALAALRRGLEVHVVADACCSRDATIHDVALARMSRAGAVVTVWESVAYEAVGAAGTDEFRALLKVVKA